MAEIKEQGLGITEIIGDKRQAILALAEHYGATHVRVFGSVARGEARPDSDLDLLVEMRAGATIFDLVGLWLDLKELLGREVSVISEGGLKERFRQRIAQDLVPL
jgi:hypothetical protein